MNRQPKNPPKWALRFLRWYCKKEYLHEIEGDLTELYHLRINNSTTLAGLFFMWNVMRSLRSSNIKGITMRNTILRSLSIRQTFRFIKRENIYSILNATSLAIGIALFVLFSWYVIEETSYDSFHTNKKNLYRVSFEEYTDQGPYATTSYPIGPAILEDFPEAVAMTRFGSGGRMIVRHREEAFFEQINFADEDFFQMFDFELINGNSETVLQAPNTVVISEQLARKYFNDQNPIGKQLKIGSGDYHSTITGVFRKVPSNSQLQFDVLISYATQHKLYDWLSTLWRQMPKNYTYLELQEGIDPLAFEEKLQLLKTKYVKNMERGDYKLMIIPLSEVHFYSGLNRELDTNGSRSSLLTFGLIAFVVLLVGIINFTNITSSRYLIRMKEMGVRKILGADRKLLIIQLLFQSFWIVMISLGLAFILITFFLPTFNTLTGKEFELVQLLESSSMLTVLTLLVFCTLIAGIAPSLSITAMSPVKTLKSKSIFHHHKLSVGKSVLLIFQYGVSIILLVGTIIMFNQMQFVEASISADEEVKLVVPVNSKIREKYESLKAGLEKHPFINSVAASSHVPGFYGDSWSVRTSPQKESVQTENFVITENYLDLMSYKLLSGRQLEKDFQSDVSSGFIINQTCVQMLGFESVEKAIGQTIYFGSDEPKEGKVVGVAEDFHFSSFREKIEPALFQFSPYEWMGYNFLVVKTTPDKISHTIEVLENEVALIDENWVVETDFFAENFRKFHLQEIRQGKLSSIFAVVAIILSCLGQLGLLINGTISRKRELAIRKVLGAKIGQLWALMTKGYVRFFALALVTGIPAAWYLMKNWLETFVYHIEIGVWPFILAATLSGLLLIIIISAITIKTAMLNPVDSLSDE